MNELSSAVLAANEVPMEFAGWGVLVLSVVVTVLWLLYVYRD